MEIIASWSRTGAGVYGGAVGYFDFARQHGLCIAIRTLVLEDGRATVQAGAGIVADSDPRRRSTQRRAAKARAMLRGARSWRRRCETRGDACC